MTNQSFDEILEARLNFLFKKYSTLLEEPEQLEILSRGYVYSKVNPDAKILVMGINPSLRTDFVNEDGKSYNYLELQNDRYFKKFYSLLKDFEPKGITYCDLFYQRHSEQKKLSFFLKDEQGRNFLRDQLKITLDTITYINPELILLFNRQGAQFLSKDWMDIGTLNMTSLNTFNATKYIPSLKSFLYLSPFVGYRTSKIALQNIITDLQILKKLKINM